MREERWLEGEGGFPRGGERTHIRADMGSLCGQQTTSCCCYICACETTYERAALHEYFCCFLGTDPVAPLLLHPLERRLSSWTNPPPLIEKRIAASPLKTIRPTNQPSNFYLVLPRRSQISSPPPPCFPVFFLRGGRSEGGIYSRVINLAPPPLLSSIEPNEER